MLDSIKDWFVDRLHKYMDAAREIVENNEEIRSAETYYSTVKATLKKEAALLTKTFCIGMGGILATMLCGWLAELLGHGILKVISAVLALLCVCIVAFILLAVIGLLLMLRTFFFANRSMADEWQKVVSDEQYADYVEQSKFLTMTRDKNQRTKCLIYLAAYVAAFVLVVSLWKALGVVSYVFCYLGIVLLIPYSAYYVSVLLKALFATGKMYEFKPGVSGKAAQHIREERQRRQEEARCREAEAKQAKEAAIAAERSGIIAHARQYIDTLERTHPEYCCDRAQKRAEVKSWIMEKCRLNIPDAFCDAYSDLTLGECVLLEKSKNILHLCSEIETQHFQLNSKLNLILESVTGLAESVCSNYRNQIASAAAEAARVEQEQEERERKARELGEAGEKEVNYKLKWWLAEHSAYRSIAADCVSKYSGGCIRIAAWDYMKEPQEIDHLLVGPAGVIHIETKNYVGTIRVDDTNYWDRDMRNAGHFTTTESPAFQVKRHAALLSKIVGEDVPVCGIICLANPNVKLQDADNSEIPVVKLGELPELLDALDKSTASPLTAQKVTEVIGKIEKAKVRGVPQSQCNPTAKAGGLWCEPRA